MKNIFKSKIFRYILLLVLIVLFVTAFHWTKEIMWAKKQSAIKTVPEDIIQAMQNEGYTINSKEYIDEEHYYSGPMSHYNEYGYYIKLFVEENRYDMNIILTDNWKVAKLSEEGINGLDYRMNGGFRYAFYHGAVLVSISPSDKGFGDDLYKIVKKLQ
jgi:hypothetical protein